jgi:hypothetical protein
MMTIELTGQPSQPSEVLGGPLPSITIERRIAATPTRHDVRPLLDREFAERAQSQAPADSAFLKVHWTYVEALSWVFYRDPERFGSIDVQNFRRLNWYDPAFQACCKAFRRECELGNVVGFRRGAMIAPAGWIDLDARKDPDIVFASAGVVLRWPAHADTITDDDAEVSSQAVPTGDKIDDDTRAKLTAIVALYRKGARATKPHRNIKSPSRRVSSLQEFAYRVLLEVQPRRKQQHNAEVEKQRVLKAQRENSCVINGAPPATAIITAKLPAQVRELDDGFSAERIRHLILDLQNNKYPWLIDGEAFSKMKDSPGVPPPDIDNEPYP